MCLLPSKVAAAFCSVSVVALLGFYLVASMPKQDPTKVVNLPSSKLLLEPVPGMPRPVNSFPATMALQPGGRYLAILNNGYGTEESRFQQSIAVLDFRTNELRDFPDSRFLVDSRQTYFLGLA